MKSEKILGVKIDNLSKKEIKEKINFYLFNQKNKTHQIATINPEFILLAQKNKVFKEVLNKSSLKVTDGFGIKVAFWLKRKKNKTRWTGVDLLNYILFLSNKNNLKIFLLTNKKGLSLWKETAQAIEKKYPYLLIRGYDYEIKLDNTTIKNIQDKVKNSQADILFCNWGAPQQEIILSYLVNANISLKLVMGVGGSFDFLTQKLKRAPLWMRKIGLEWLYRFYQQPWRWKRIFNATIVFLWKVIKS